MLGKKEVRKCGVMRTPKLLDSSFHHHAALLRSPRHDTHDGACSIVTACLHLSHRLRSTALRQPRLLLSAQQQRKCLSPMTATLLRPVAGAMLASGPPDPPVLAAAPSLSQALKIDSR